MSFLTGTPDQLFSQVISESEPSKVIIRNADNYVAEIINDVDVQFLKGSVQLVHDSTFMYCDSAIVRENLLTAINDVIIIKPDSINVFADSLAYDGDNKTARLFYDVVLENFDKQLFTDSLYYDLDKEIATFSDTAILRKNTMRLSSVEGVYNMKNKLAFFYRNVTIRDKNFDLITDSLKYDISTDRAYFIGPSYITQGSRKIYCESGYYDVEEGRANFSTNAIVRDGSKTAIAQTILYNEADSLVSFIGDAEIIDSISVTRGNTIVIDDKSGDIIIQGNAYYQTEDQLIKGEHITYNKNTEDFKLEGRSTVYSETYEITGDTITHVNATDMGRAVGNVIWKDTLGEREMRSDLVFFRDSTDYYQAVTVKRRPLFIQLIEEDTLFLSADTLLKYTLGDTASVMAAYYNVKIFKSDLQAKSDSLHYSDIDSSYTLFRDPVCWSDTTQFTSDSIRISIMNDQVRNIDLLENAFIAIEDPDQHYDQIKGRYIHSLMADNKLKQMDVVGNAESIYYVKDDESAYIGPNHTRCARIIFYFEADSLINIRYYNEPDSEMIPYQKATEKDKYLEGFKWRINEKPSSVDQIILKSKVVRSINIESEKIDTFENEVNKVIQGIRSKESVDEPQSKVPPSGKNKARSKK